MLPISRLIRIKVNEKIHSHFNQLLLKKTDSLAGLEFFEDKSFQNRVDILREETKRRPMNLVYIVTDSLKELITIISILIFLGSISFGLSLIMICSVLPQVIFAFYSEKKVWDYSLFQSEEARKMSRISALCLDTSAAKEARVFGFGNYLFEKFSFLARSFYANMANLRKKQFLASIPYSVCALAGQLMTIGWIAWQLRQGAFSIPVILVMIQSLHFLQREVLSLIQDMTMLSSSLSYFETFRSFLSQKDALSQSHSALPLEAVQSIEFQNVSFGYGKKPVLKGLSCHIQAGEKIAIVGANGSGKSSLMKLLCRFYDPEDGVIKINGIDLRDFDLSQWRNHLSAVFQDYGKYPFTLGENIGIASPLNIDDESRLTEALKKSGLGYLLERFPQGLRSLLTKEFGGEELSFGEWQKLAIARLFFRDSPLIIMDEPTASLDPNSEYEVFQRLLHAFDGKTIFLITHRLNSVKRCDRILLLKEGQIVEEGSHTDLMLRQGEYYGLFSLQAAGYQDQENFKSQNEVEILS